MTVLRSREIVPTLPIPKTTRKTPKTTPNPVTIEPSTPAQTDSTPTMSSLRRSLRLSGTSAQLSDTPRRVRRRTSHSPSPDDYGKRKLEFEQKQDKARFTREEKGKGILVDEDQDQDVDMDSGCNQNVEDNDIDNDNDNDDDDIRKLEEVVVAVENNVVEVSVAESLMHLDRQRSEQSREMARRHALGFERGETYNAGNGAEEEGAGGDGPALEDWPGPFSTALKIIRDRETRGLRENRASVAAEAKSADVKWVPRGGDGVRSSVSVPSLVDMCVKVVCDNADGLVSLEHVPEALTERMCRILCDSRRMNACFLRLLVRGSPAEISLRDCSWLAEEEFVDVFQGFDTSRLTVLKLDQCGRCLPDYVILASLARSTSCLPVLNTISLCGGCRLSDVGLNALVSSAPALRSVNLSQCSLLTHSSIEVLAKSYGSTLKELYLEDCQDIDAMLMLPFLEKFEQLDILSVAGIVSVCDKFISGFINARGSNLKELNLTDCVKVTDVSLKAISENCPGLCAIDLTRCKLTDSSLGYLANGCRSIQRLKLCANSFSDKSIAAFLESSGAYLEELSLNNVRKVGSQTALSIATRAMKLQSLDLSWCRDLSDNALGLIVDKCTSLRVLKLFGCTQVTEVFLKGHSNPNTKIIGLEMSPLLQHL